MSCEEVIMIDLTGSLDDTEGSTKEQQALLLDNFLLMGNESGKNVRTQGQSSLSTLGDSQTLKTNKKLRVNNKKLKRLAFPRMSPDKVTLTAKKDGLICAFGSKLLKNRTNKYKIHRPSYKMRLLAAVMIAVRKINCNVKSLYQALKPDNYKLLVEATKSIAHCCEKKRLSSVPKLANNIAMSLQECIDIVLKHLLKKEITKGKFTSLRKILAFQSTKFLMTSNWHTNFSHGDTMKKNKINGSKVTMISLASDVHIFLDYLKKLSEDTATKLAIKYQPKLYDLLLESVMCRVLLLNGRLPEELQSILLDSYTNGRAQNTQFSVPLTPTEKILMKTFKCIVITDSNSCEVPVLFQREVKGHLDILIAARKKKFKSNSNPYLFGVSGQKKTIQGFAVFCKHAKLSGMQNTSGMTAIKLRKHIATVTQVFNMTPNNLKELKLFKGLTDVSYDINQCAKLGKLLLAISKHSARPLKENTLDNFSGQLKLDQLSKFPQNSISKKVSSKTALSTKTVESAKENIETQSSSRRARNIIDSWTPNQNQAVLAHLTSHINNLNPPKTNECEELITDWNLFSQSSQDSIDNKISCPTKTPKDNIDNIDELPSCSWMTRRTHEPWTQDQKDLVLDHFKNHIKESLPPRKAECEELIKNHYEILHNKSWLKIKAFVQNEYTKRRRLNEVAYDNSYLLSDEGFFSAITEMTVEQWKNRRTVGELDDETVQNEFYGNSQNSISKEEMTDKTDWSTTNCCTTKENLETPSSSRRTKRILEPWTQQQKDLVLAHFKNHIKKSLPPIEAECEELKKKHYDILHNKSWLKIKVFVQNEYTKQKRLNEARYNNPYSLTNDDILSAITNSSAKQWRGHGFEAEELDVEMEEKLLNTPSQDSINTKVHNKYDCSKTVENTNENLDTSSSNIRTKRILEPWTPEQKQLVLTHFKKNIKNCKAPTQAECEDLIEDHEDIFHNKSWLKMKVFVQNEYTKKRRSQ